MSRLPKNLHLIFSSIIVIIAALLYGVVPSQTMSLLIDITVEHIALKNILRAILGIYIVFGSFWLYSVFNKFYWHVATLTVVLFMGGLVIGRLLSIVLDGWYLPFGLGMIGEGILLVWGLWNLLHYKRRKSIK